MSKIMVTGGSGFVGSHIVLKLLQEGHVVVTTVRNAEREAYVRMMVNNGGWTSHENLSFSYADLTDDAGWAATAQGCDYVLHVASPFPAHDPEDENDLIIPAREGTLRVLRAARDAAVKRVVLTSSFAAIGYGHENYDKVFDETDWTNPDGPNVAAYIKSKVLAERAAWEFMDHEGGGLEISVINPVGIFGPVLGPRLPSSVELVKQLLEGSPPHPGLNFGLVDVRDLADLHIMAMTSDAVRGQRFLAVSGDVVSHVHVANVLKECLGETAASVCDAEAEAKVGGTIRRSTSAKSQTVFRWQPRAQEKTIIDTALSLMKFGGVMPRTAAQPK